MSHEPIPLHNNKPFLVRDKEIDMSDEEFDREKKDNNHRLVKDTRGKIFQLAGITGEFFRLQKNNEEYPIVLRAKERHDGDFDLLNIVSKISKIEANENDTSDDSDDAISA